MKRAFGVYPMAPRWLKRVARSLTVPSAISKYARLGTFSPDSGYARERSEALRAKLQRGETVYLLGIHHVSHNSGVALVEVHAERGIRVLCNNEEERFAAVKHYSGFPALAVEDLKTQMSQMGLGPRNLHACLDGANW